jgi:hypothetical protein
MFSKKPLTIKEQIKQLQDRGLHISNIDLAEKYLSHISYYRLGEYWYVMQEDKEKHIFKAKSNFKDVVALYNFDAELRLLLFDVIEKIEISLRTKLIYHLSHEFDAWWFQNFELFEDSMALVKTLSNLQEELTRSKDVTIKNHFKNHKDDKRFPPAWKSLEQTSFGALSKLYGNLRPTIKSKNTIIVALIWLKLYVIPSLTIGTCGTPSLTIGTCVNDSFIISSSGIDREIQRITALFGIVMKIISFITLPLYNPTTVLSFSKPIISLILSKKIIKDMSLVTTISSLIPFHPFNVNVFLLSGIYILLYKY